MADGWELKITAKTEEAWEEAAERARRDGEAGVWCLATLERITEYPAGPIDPEPVVQGFRVSFDLAPYDLDPGWRYACGPVKTEAIGRPLEPEDFEEIPTRDLIAQAIEGATVVRTHRGKIKFAADLTETERQGLEDRQRAQTRTPQKGQPVTDEQLQHVAELYQHRLAAGSRRPTQDLADMLDIPRPTVARWLVDARKRGLLSQGRRDQETRS